MHAEQFRKTLVEWIGNGKDMTVAELSQASGVSERNIYAYMDPNQGRPSYENAMAIIAAMPPEFAQQVFVTAGIGYVERRDPEAKACPNKLLTRGLKEMYDLAAYLEDGVLNYIERAKLRKSLPGLQAKITRMMNSLWREAL